QGDLTATVAAGPCAFCIGTLVGQAPGVYVDRTMRHVGRRQERERAPPPWGRGRRERCGAPPPAPTAAGADRAKFIGQRFGRGCTAERQPRSFSVLRPTALPRCRSILDGATPSSRATIVARPLEVRRRRSGHGATDRPATHRTTTPTRT